jgi:hypothetical protein
MTRICCWLASRSACIYEAGVSRWLAKHATLTPRYPLLINATRSLSSPYESSDVCDNDSVLYRVRRLPEIRILGSFYLRER